MGTVMQSYCQGVCVCVRARARVVVAVLLQQCAKENGGGIYPTESGREERRRERGGEQGRMRQSE